MNKAILGLLFAGLAAGILSAAELPQDKKIQFSLAFGFTSLTNQGDETKTSVGAEGLVIFNLGRHIMIMPEVFAGSETFSVGLTVNARFGRFFAGVGGTGGGLYQDPHEWGAIGLLKVQAGVKGPHYLVTAAYVNNLNPGNWPTLSGFSIAAGLVF